MVSDHDDLLEGVAVHRAVSGPPLSGSGRLRYRPHAIITLGLGGETGVLLLRDCARALDPVEGEARSNNLTHGRA